MKNLIARHGFETMIAIVIVIVAFLVLSFWAAFRLAHALHRESMCHCYNCQGALHMSPVILASRCCPNCGVTVLQELDPLEERNSATIQSMSHTISPSLVTVEEFRAEAEHAKRRDKISNLIFLGTSTGLMAITWLVLWLVGVQNELAAKYGGGVFIMVLVVYGISEWRFHSRLTKTKCPHCFKSLIRLTPLVIATRNCGYCGRRVLAERFDSRVQETAQRQDEQKQ